MTPSRGLEPFCRVSYARAVARGARARAFRLPPLPILLCWGRHIPNGSNFLHPRYLCKPPKVHGAVAMLPLKDVRAVVNLLGRGHDVRQVHLSLLEHVWPHKPESHGGSAGRRRLVLPGEDGRFGSPCDGCFERLWERGSGSCGHFRDLRPEL